MVTKIPKAKSEGEETLALHLKTQGIKFYREVKIVSPLNGRGYIYDFELDGYGILIEVQGGTHSGGAHTRGTSYQRDVTKMNSATLLGYKVVWFTTDDVKKGNAINFLIELIKKGAD